MELVGAQEAQRRMARSDATIQNSGGCEELEYPIYRGEIERRGPLRRDRKTRISVLLPTQSSEAWGSRLYFVLRLMDRIVYPPDH